MNALELLEHCEKNGIYLHLQSGKLEVIGNLKKIGELAPKIKEHKANIIRLLETGRINNRASGFVYREGPLIRYFINEGWIQQSAVELARRMIERRSWLPAHEQVKYLACERQENEQ